jgi:preprotein translocase subunit SecF
MDNAEKPEIDLVDDKGENEKLEVYEQKEEPISKEEIIEVKTPEQPKVELPKEPKEKFSKRVLNFYDKKYKQLMIIPLLMLLIAVIVIGVQIATTGSFINKDVSLKGGVTLTITKEEAIDIIQLERFLGSSFSGRDISVRAINAGGRQIGTVIAADIDASDEAELDQFIAAVEDGIGHELAPEDYGIEIMGSSLGASFFRETFTALIIAFVLMSIVVFIYFRSFVPSFAVILSAMSDIVVTLAIVDLVGMKISTGGIAAFLMLVGYSVDTDMLLTTRLLKRKGGTVFERTMSSVKTGMMMTVTTIGALLVGLIFMESAVVRQIMFIVLIGLFVDIINTWIQNVGILRYYIEKK